MGRVSIVSVIMLLAAPAVAQQDHDLSAPASSATLLQSLPLPEEKRAALHAAIGKRDYLTAENLLAEEADRNPKSQAFLLALANVLFLDGKQLNSAMVLKKAESLGPLDERNRFLLALSYIAINRKNLARPELETLARSNPSNAVYPYWLSRLAYRKTDLQEALSYAEKAVRLDPAFMKAYDQLGLCYAGLQQNDAAIGAYKQAIRLNQQQLARWPWPAMNLGTLFLRLERLDEAEAQLRDSIRIDPSFPVAHYRLGQVLEKKSRDQEAITELEQAAKLDPTYPEPHYAMARIQRKIGNLQAAAREIQLFEDLRKTDKLKGITRPD